MFKHLFSLAFLATVLFSCGNKDQAPPATPAANTPAPAPAVVADPVDVFLTDFKAAVASNDPNKVATFAAFPLKSVETETKEGFLAMYEYSFDESSRKKIAASTKADWQMQEIGEHKGLTFTVRGEVSEEEKKDGLEGSSTTYMINKVGDKYMIIGIWMAG